MYVRAAPEQSAAVSIVLLECVRIVFGRDRLLGAQTSPTLHVGPFGFHLGKGATLTVSLKGAGWNAHFLPDNLKQRLDIGIEGRDQNLFRRHDIILGLSRGGRLVPGQRG